MTSPLKSRIPYFENNVTWDLLDFLHWSVLVTKDFGNKEEEHRKYKIYLEKFIQDPHLIESHSSELVQKLASDCLKSFEVKTVLSCLIFIWDYSKNKG